MATLTLDQAAAKYGVEKKKLVGHCMRNDFDDPLVVDRLGESDYLIADDWRLARLANPEQPVKSI